MNVVITGAGKGIGRAVALRLAARGSSLVLVDLDEAALAEAAGSAAAAGAEIATVLGSVADADTASRAAAAAEAFGGATGLSHNAGIQRYGNVLDTSPALWDEVIAVNLTAGYVMAHALMPQLVANKGSLVFMASVQGLATQENVAAYTTAKHGLIGLAKSIAVDFAAKGVRSNAVAPGSVMTPMLQQAVASSPDPDTTWAEIRAMHPMGRPAEASEIAEVVAFLLSDAASFLTGEVIRVDGGLLARIGGSPQTVERT